MSEQTTPDNPKKLYGDKKPPLAQLPLVAQVAASLAHYDGDLKYGTRNWRKQPVEVMTYVNAALRHLRLYEEGEEFARDTGVPNLGAVIACCAILLDASVNDALIDNRSPSKGAADYLHDAEKFVETLKQADIKRRGSAPPARAYLDRPAVPGDTVECVDATGTNLVTAGATYKVLGTEGGFIRVLGNLDYEGGMYTTRFRVVAP